MAIRAETFIALESTLSRRLLATLGEVLKPTYRAVEEALAAGDYQAARKLVQAINLDAVYSSNEDFILLLSRMAAIFGASRVTRSPGTTLVSMGFERTTMEMAAQSLRLGIRQNVQEAMVRAGLQSIAAKEAEATGQPVKKDDDYFAVVLKAKKASAILPFASFMNAQGKAFMNIASSLHTSRLSAFGYVAEAEYLGHTYYQINEQLDGRTCPLCALMHRKSFRVSDARALLDIVVRTQDPDELKALQPWPSQSAADLKQMAQLSPEQLVSRGWHVPPFHPRCRGLLSPSGKVPKLPVPKSTKPEPPSTQADFEQLGIKLSPEKVSLWNELMQSPPSSVLSQLTGTTPDELMQAALSSPLAGYKVSVGKNGVRLRLNSPAFGSTDPVAQDYFFRTNLSALVGSVEVPEGKFELARKALKALFYTAKNSSMKTLAMMAEQGSDGYTMARMGFASAVEQWTKIKASILGSSQKQTLILSAPAAERKALELIMASPDPKSLFALSDLPTLGKSLLHDIPWAGSLALEDVESVTRFAAAMGAKL